MIIFIDDRPIRITSLSKKNDLPLKEDFDLIIDARLKPIKIKEFKGHTCLLNVSLVQMGKIIEDLHQFKLDFHSLYILVDNKKAFKQKIISLYSLIEASGGVVLNEENKLLWIYRLGKWDLPKGKLEKNESFKVAAIREVEEECNVQAKLEFKLSNSKSILTKVDLKIKLRVW